MADTLATPVKAARPNIGLRSFALLGMLAMLCAAFVLSLMFGSVRIPLDQVLLIVAGGQPARATWATIVLDFRLPKALTALLAGAALGVSGLQMQTLFRNPLADPFVLGVSSGAGLGVALVVLSVGAANTALLAVAGLLGNLGLVTAASVGAGMVLLVVLTLARRVQSSTTLLLVGLMISYATGALVSLLLFWGIAERIQAYIAWSFGGFGGVTWSRLQVFALAVGLGMLLAPGGTLRCGAPEDLVLDGGFDATFAGDGIAFDSRRGTFELHTPSLARASLTGDGIAATWTAKALERCGYAIAAAGEAATLRVVVHEAPRSWDVTLPDGTQRRVRSVGELAGALRVSANPRLKPGAEETKPASAGFVSSGRGFSPGIMRSVSVVIGASKRKELSDAYRITLTLGNRNHLPARPGRRFGRRFARMRLSARSGYRAAATDPLGYSRRPAGCRDRQAGERAAQARRKLVSVGS